MNFTKTHTLRLSAHTCSSCGVSYHDTRPNVIYLFSLYINDFLGTTVLIYLTDEVIMCKDNYLIIICEARTYFRKYLERFCVHRLSTSLDKQNEKVVRWWLPFNTSYDTT